MIFAAYYGANPNLRGDIPMTGISMSDLFTIIFVLVDDWYQTKGVKLLKCKAGAISDSTDSEMIALMFAQEFIPFPGETRYVGFIRANYLSLSPKLVIG